MTIRELQELLEAWTFKHGIRNTELTNMAVLTERVGELARAIAMRHGEHPEASNRAPLTRELGDILWSVAAIANQAGVDLTIAVTEALEHQNSRK